MEATISIQLMMIPLRFRGTIVLAMKKTFASFRANCDVMDESYVLEGYPHGCGVRLYSMVEYLTSLEDLCCCLHLSLDLMVLGEYVVL